MDLLTNTLQSGIKTQENRGDDQYGYKVEWIEWDSDFRNSKLQHADIIVAVNGKTYLEENREEEQSRAIGNYLESTYWTEQKANNGELIELKIFRDGEFLSISGKIQQQQIYRNTEQRLIMGLNGPLRMSNDGFSSSWANWYDKFVRHASHYIDDRRWERAVIDNRMILKEHLEWKERIDYLLKHYPGRFAEMVLADWEKVREILTGIRYDDITADTLEYRKIGEQRALLVKEASMQAKKIFSESRSAYMIPTFPAMNPVVGNVPEVTGKIVELPAITFNQFINDLGKSFAVIGSAKNGYYFIHLNGKEMDIFFRTIFHYQAQVTPNLAERYEFTAEILNEPAIISYEGRAVTGLMVKVKAGMAGENNVFIDLTGADEKGNCIFAGEESLSIFSGYSLSDSATPQQTIEAMVYYIKLGDKSAWQKLFCNWQIYSDWEGPPYMDMAFWFTEESYQHVWEQSRRQILNDFYDARVLHIYPIKIVIEEDKKNGVPKVEQVKLILDHIGKFDGVYQSLSNLYVHRKWTLQRLDGGPWRIKELQAL